MNTPSLVSESTQDALDRAQWEYHRARKEYYETWLAWHREAYAAAECADAPASAETET